MDRHVTPSVFDWLMKKLSIEELGMEDKEICTINTL
jgi:hypothetical protein